MWFGRTLASATTLLTAVPMHSKHERELDPDAAAFFPLIGVALGGFILLLLEIARSVSTVIGSGTLLERGGLLLGALVVGLSVVLTRSLHWDGLADTADAIWSPDGTQRKLEIMSDSATGAFGTMAVALVVVVQVAAYDAILQSPAVLGWAILGAPVAGRAAASFAAWLGTPAKPEGLGTTVMGRPSVAAVAVFSATLIGAFAVVVAAHELHGVVWVLIAVLAAPVVPHLMASRIGGVTGDVMGASVLLTETLLLAVAGVLTVL